MEQLRSKWQLVDVPMGRIKLDTGQPRQDFPGAERKELTANLIEHGQKEPITGYWEGDYFIVVSGTRRCISGADAGLEKMLAVVMDHKPEPAELFLHQFLANEHRLNLNPVELCAAYLVLMRLMKINATELAQTVSKSKTYVSNVLSIDGLGAEAKQLIREGRVGLAKAAMLARLSPEEQQLATKKLLGGRLTREQLERLSSKNKPNGKAVRRVTLETPVATMSLVSKTKLTIDELLELLQTLVRECKRARSQSLDLSTLSSILRDRAKLNQTGGA